MSINKNDTFKDFDTDLVFRNMIFAVIYVGAILVFFSYILWPTILDFKAEYITEKRHKIIYNEVQKGFEASKDRLTTFLQENQTLLNRLDSKDPYNILQNLSEKYLTKYTIKKISNKADSQAQIKTTIYQITAQTSTIQNLWDYIAELNKTSSSIIVNIPIRIQKLAPQVKAYEVVFNVDIAQNTYAINPLIKNIVEQTIAQTPKNK